MYQNWMEIEPMLLDLEPDWSPVSDVHIDGLVQERRNTIANALELGLPYVDPLI